MSASREGDQGSTERSVIEYGINRELDDDSDSWFVRAGHAGSNFFTGFDSSSSPVLGKAESLFSVLASFGLKDLGLMTSSLVLVTSRSAESSDSISGLLSL